MPQFEFHVSRQARARYAFEETLLALSGNVVFANFYAARVFAQKMNRQRDVVNHPEQAVRAGHLNAMGLIDEVLHYVVAQYRAQVNPQAMSQALAWLDRMLGRDVVDKALTQFADEFPNGAVYRGEINAAQFLQGETEGVPHRQIILEEMLMLWLANVNPAFAPFIELFDDTSLETETAYNAIIANLHTFFETQPRFGPDHQPLIEMLRAPALASPHSLEGQLEFIRMRWGTLIGPHLTRLLSSLDLISEETRMFFPGPGEARVPEYKPGALGVYEGVYPEYERFSRDLDWMPRVVLIAKSTYVWLDQLAKKYQCPITRLDQIPDEELDLLARRGLTGLWLIGVWQRSPASKRIKELCGAPLAEASAYAVYDYRIADDLGGDAALENLKARAWQRGIRLASDMVPNHMGIDSRWVIEHPDWFIQSSQPPFPTYTFTGENLSRDPRVGIYLEDHYYDRTDAAVVFKRVDHWTGDTRYIYHGNDGTSFPWNDTAQLNFLRADVREAVIQTILHVARQFPIIRLDAAMTLTKKHYQRLWFPQPGMGGDIPSRADFAMTKEQFDAAMPEEFWREVVDRVAVEAPDTLLLAEAFWLMEGYFVRTLGMHRVYNSAFMNMLRDERNANYRSVIKNTLEFDPEILKRYVNFMNNPDERTAVEQFGKGDKYFGICTMMVTLPGLPMFGHGQIEGFAERYGMEFRRALWDEAVDEHLVSRHEREIFPLLHRRRLFADVENFLLYDFFTANGAVNEDVFAYSNRLGEERGLVIYHNKFANTVGWIRTSAAYLDKPSGKLVQRTLGEGLGLPRDENQFVIFRDQVSGLEYLRNAKTLCEQGLYIELGAYARHVFLDFRWVSDSERGEYARLCTMLAGRGVPSIAEALCEMNLQPIHQPFRELVNADTLRRWLTDPTTDLLDEIAEKFLQFACAAKRFGGGSGDEIALTQQTRREIETVLRLRVRGRVLQSESRQYRAAIHALKSYLADDAVSASVLVWTLVHALGQLQGDGAVSEQSWRWLAEWRLSKLITQAFHELGWSEASARHAVATIRVMTKHQRWFRLRNRKTSRARCVLDAWFADDETRQYLQVNRFNEIVWFNKEAFETLVNWMLVVAGVALSSGKRIKQKEIVAAHQVVKNLWRAEKKSKYQVDKLLAIAK